MTVKINLTLDEKIVARSKKYAAMQNTSVSKLVQAFLEKTTANIQQQDNESFAEKYAGSANAGIPDLNAVKDEYLKKKYGY